MCSATLCKLADAQTLKAGALDTEGSRNGQTPAAHVLCRQLTHVIEGTSLCCLTVCCCRVTTANNRMSAAAAAAPAGEAEATQGLQSTINKCTPAGAFPGPTRSGIVVFRGCIDFWGWITCTVLPLRLYAHNSLS